MTYNVFGGTLNLTQSINLLQMISLWAVLMIQFLLQSFPDLTGLSSELLDRKIFCFREHHRVEKHEQRIVLSMVCHRRSQDFLWGALFSPQKVDDLFSVITLKTQAKATKLTTPIVQISPISSKNCTFALPGGCMLCVGGALTTFPCKFAPPPQKFFFSALGRGCLCTHCTPWLCLYSMVSLHLKKTRKFDNKSISQINCRSSVSVIAGVPY